MSNASLKEQLEAVASELSEKLGIEKSPAPKPSTGQKSVSNPPAQYAKKPFHKPGGKPAVNLDKKPKPKWLDYAQYGLELLKVYFPQSFKTPREIKPLKKGIKQDLVKRLSEISTIVTDDKACMVKSLAFYVNTSAYHRSVIEGVMRIDLDGAEAGTVSKEEAQYSSERFKAKMNAKNAPPLNNKKETTED